MQSAFTEPMYKLESGNGSVSLSGQLIRHSLSRPRVQNQ